MLGPIGHIASLLAYATQRRSRSTADASTHADIAWSRSPRAGDLPAGLELAWLGNTSAYIREVREQYDVTDCAARGFPVQPPPFAQPAPQ